MLSRTVLTLITALLFLLSTVVLAQDQTGRTYTRADFINIEGGSLQEKIDRAVQQFKSARQGDTLWIAYHFQARDGMQLGPFSGTVYSDSDGVRLTYRESPDGAAVFLLTDASGARPAFIRIKTLNVNEPYLFENRPVYWLGNIDLTQSLQHLETIMRSDPENKDRVRGALRAIGAHNSPRVIPLLKEVALKDRTLDIQRAAVSNLARIPAKESLDALDELFAAAESVTVKQEIVRAYTTTGDRVSERRVLERLTTIAKSEERLEIRAEAVRRIAAFRGDAIADRLFEIYDRINDHNIKLEILRRVAVSDGKDDVAVKRLVAIAKREGDTTMQREAIKRLPIRSEDGVTALIEIYDSSSNDVVKEEVLGRLVQSQSKRAGDKLMAVAKDDTNPKMRQSAIRKLSNRAASFTIQ
jgi:HEAT repeat protein